MDFLLATLSTLSIIPTALMLVMALVDRRRRKLAGINGELAALANQSVNRETLRLIKHALMVFGFWMYIAGKPQTWINPAVCWLLAGVSVYELWFRHWIENYIQRNKGTRYH